MTWNDFPAALKAVHAREQDEQPLNSLPSCSRSRVRPVWLLRYWRKRRCDTRQKGMV